jgi:hypothetical protein
MNLLSIVISDNYICIGGKYPKLDMKRKEEGP